MIATTVNPQGGAPVDIFPADEDATYARAVLYLNDVLESVHDSIEEMANRYIGPQDTSSKANYRKALLCAQAIERDLGNAVKAVGDIIGALDLIARRTRIGGATVYLAK